MVNTKEAVCSLTSWYESDRIDISGRRTDDISAGGKVFFLDLGGHESFHSFLLSEPFLQLFLQKASLMVNKLVPVLARKCFILCYIWITQELWSEDPFLYSSLDMEK